MAPKTTPRTIAKIFAGKTFRTSARLAAVVALAGLASACSDRNYAAKEGSDTPTAKREYNPNDPTVFGGSDGLSVGSLNSANPGLLGGGGDEKARLPVNKYLWQGALDTLSFLPLSSSDPFTGVIATDWGSTPEAPGERLKVTAYILNPGLTAAALKVAVYREVRSETGLWVPAPVSAETGRRLEDAILGRARQIRIAEREGTTTG